MYNRLISFINENKLLYDYQFGLKKEKSTHMAMVMLIDKISEALDRGDCVIGVFLDFWYRWPQNSTAKTKDIWNQECFTTMVWELPFGKDPICNT